MPEPVLSPYHFGEALAARLLQLANISELPLYDPADPSTIKLAGSVLGPSSGVESVIANAALDTMPGRPSFDGMHSIDCALVFRESVIAIELKLGESRLGAKNFCERFASNVPRPTHAGRRIAGSMIALLDWNGRVAPKEQPEVALRVRGRPVQQRWLLMLRKDTWNNWARTNHLPTALGTHQLAGVVTIEDLAHQVGGRHVKEVALELARDSIESWFAATELTRER